MQASMQTPIHTSMHATIQAPMQEQMQDLVAMHCMRTASLNSNPVHFRTAVENIPLSKSANAHVLD